MGKITGAALVPRVSSIWDISLSKLSKSRKWFLLRMFSVLDTQTQLLDVIDIRYAIVSGNVILMNLQT